jgi:23S rRNA (cytidine1920-2'-O)/16S rRNA (cytidine1409-2'-O)-methyltransferase
LLQAGVKQVYAVDVGHGQLAWKLRRDDRVVVMEKTNARHLTPAHMPRSFSPVDLVVIDCSFISLRKILPPAVALLRATGKIVALIKPQFEAGKENVGKGGVVRDENVRERTVEEVVECARELGFQKVDVIPSPLLGPAGNHEYLAYLQGFSPDNAQNTLAAKTPMDGR